MTKEKVVLSEQVSIGQSQEAPTDMADWMQALLQANDIRVAALQMQLAKQIEKNKLLENKCAQVKDERKQFEDEGVWFREDNVQLKKENQVLKGQYVLVERERTQLKNACTGFKTENVRLKRACREHKEGFAKLEKIADRDPLTGAYNRRYLDGTVKEIISNEFRAKRSWGILMVDIDHFKKCNDTHGHSAGDDVLKNVVQMLQEVSRARDFVIRYGGEEFCIIIFDIEKPELCVIAERYRTAVAATCTGIEKGESISVTVSIGACFVPGDSTMELKSAIELADNALYAAKDSGRDCFLLHDKRKHDFVIHQKDRRK